MSDDKKDFFDYDSYIKDNVGKMRSGKYRKAEHAKQKPPRFASAKKEREAVVARQLKKEAEDMKQPKNEPSAVRPQKKRTEHESIESIKRMFGEALDETSEDLAELTVEQPEPDAPIANPEGIRRKLYYLFGIVLSLLAIVGLISTINFTRGAIKNFADNTQQKNEFAKFIYPIVICDPAPFNQTVKLRSDTMLTAAIWDIILYEDKTKYEADFDMIIVPEVDVEQHATRLFGTGLSFEHQSLLNADVQFYYDDTIKSYRVPSNPKYFTYSPYIEEVSRVGDRYTLVVGYVSPTPAWLTLTSDDEPEPEKYVEYVVAKRSNDMTLVAIQESDKVVDSPHGL